MFAWFGISGAEAIQDDNRLVLESRLHAVDAQRGHFEDFETIRAELLKLSAESRIAGYPDIALQALNSLASEAGQFFQFRAMKEAIDELIVILNTFSNRLDSLDLEYSVRMDSYCLILSFYSKTGELDKSEKIVRILKDHMQSASKFNQYTLFNGYSYVADMFIKRGLLDQAYLYYKLMDNLVFSGEDSAAYRYYADIYKCTYFYLAGEPHQAKLLLTRSLRKLKQMDPRQVSEVFQVRNYEILGLVFQQLGYLDSAIMHFKKALSLRSAGDLKVYETYEYIGDCLLQAGDGKGAIEYYNRVYKKFPGSDRSFAHLAAKILSKMAKAYFIMNQPQSGLQMIQQANSLLYHDPTFQQDPFKNPDSHQIYTDKTSLRLLMLKPLCLFKLAQMNGSTEFYLTQAIHSFRLASSSMDHFRSLINTDEFKNFFVKDVRDMYEKAVQACWMLYRNNRADSVAAMALFFIEKSRNQVLLDAIRANRAENVTGLPKEILTQETVLKSGIVNLGNELIRLQAQGANENLITMGRKELAIAEQDYVVFLDELERKYPRYYQMKYKNEVPAYPILQKAIGKKTALFYMTGHDFVAIVGIGKGKLVFELLKLDTTFTGHVEGLLRHLNRPRLDELNDPRIIASYCKHAHFLYKYLVHPVVGKLADRGQLIIVPDGILWYLPFDALIRQLPDDNQHLNWRELDYLLHSYRVGYGYAAELLLGERQNNVLADHRRLYAGFAPAYQIESGRIPVHALGRSKKGYLLPLQYNSWEVEQAAECFNGKGFTGEAVTSLFFKAQSTGSRIVHFAGHAILNDSMPELSGLFFSNHLKSLPSHNQEDDVLYLNEILTLRLQAQLAILSACETGSGRLLQGEGLMSIGRAFRYAGCSNLIFTLWNINDRSAAEIMNSFSQNLKRGMKIDEALHAAKIRYLSKSDNGNNAHPFLWAAFSYTGGEARLFIQKWVICLVIGFVFLLGVFMLQFKPPAALKKMW